MKIIRFLPRKNPDVVEKRSRDEIEDRQLKIMIGFGWSLLLIMFIVSLIYTFVFRTH